MLAHDQWAGDHIPDGTTLTGCTLELSSHTSWLNQVGILQSFVYLKFFCLICRVNIIIIIIIIIVIVIVIIWNVPVDYYIFLTVSHDRYYDENGDCVPCSKCCGDGQDVTKDECRQKLGEASKRICSFSSNISRCSTITSTPKQTNTMSGKKKLDTKLIAVSVSVSSVVVGLIVVIAACRYRCFSSRRCSFLWHESSDEAEIGIQFCQYAVNDPKQSVVQSSQGNHHFNIFFLLEFIRLLKRYIHKMLCLSPIPMPV